MKLTKRIALLSLLLTSLISMKGGIDDPWRADQLMPPQVLAAVISSGNNVPMILDIGPDVAIKGAIVVGPVEKEEGMAILLKQLKGLAKTKPIVIYCGCCPLSKCPNVRPAFSFLVAQGFTNVQVLNLKNNLKSNWIDKGYPVDEGK